MIGVAQAVLRVAGAALFPSDVVVVGAAGVHPLLRCQSHDGGPKHAPSLAGTRGARRVSLCMGACAWGAWAHHLCVCAAAAALLAVWTLRRSPPKGSANALVLLLASLALAQSTHRIPPPPGFARLRLHTPTAESVHGYHEGYSSMRDHAAVLDGT